MRVAAQVTLTASERRRLETWASARSTAVRLVERSKIILMACAGMTNQAIAHALGIDQNTVGRWRNRFVKEGAKGIEKERPRGGNYGGKDSKQQEKLRARIVKATTQTTPKDATHWSTRTMARAMGTTHSFVHRVWQSHGLKPHLIRTFKISNDPRFEEKLHDVVGLYLSPPENAVVFSFDEKSSVQALDRTQPGLPIKKGRCGTMTHDYKRHGTTTLFAALDVATGAVIGESYRQHRHQEVLRFLKKGRQNGAEGARAPHHSRQLRHAQARRSAAVDRRPEAHLSAFHSHEFILAEHGRAILPHVDGPADSTWGVHLREGARSSLGGVHRHVQRKPPAFRVDEISQADSRKGWSCSPNARPPERLIATLPRTLH